MTILVVIITLLFAFPFMLWSVLNLTQEKFSDEFKKFKIIGITMFFCYFIDAILILILIMIALEVI